MVKKELMIEALKKNMGIISSACEEVGISRQTHYNWLKDDEVYRKDAEEILEYTLDYVENKLLEKIKEGDNTAIIFYLKTKGKKRGYIERAEQEITHKGEGFKLIIEKEDVTQKRAN